MSSEVNNAKMREALEKCANWGEQIDCQLGSSDETVYAFRHERCLAHNISECARAALAAPATEKEGENEMSIGEDLLASKLENVQYIARELAIANMLKAVELKLRFDGNLKPEDSESLKKIVEDAIKKERWAFFA